jgi:NAD-dependent SIR2 family protein deacetylase
LTLITSSREQDEARTLFQFIRQHRRLTILSGAGCSTASGIPEYRDDDGRWKHKQPMQFQDFVGDMRNRQRYWAQSFVGWQRIANAKPNPAHIAIARLEDSGHINCVITQNVDNLHRAAGSKNVIDLHGVLHRIRCLGCDKAKSRKEFQESLGRANPHWNATLSAVAPDGDARISGDDFASFVVPGCDECDGILKPDVVFFGEPVAAGKVAAAREELDRSSALLIVGSSLMVFSGYRFAREANSANIPVAIVNRGITRADQLASIKLSADCADVLARTVDLLAA